MVDRMVKVLIEAEITQQVTTTWYIDEDEYKEWLGDRQDDKNAVREFIQAGRYYREDVSEAMMEVPMRDWDVLYTTEDVIEVLDD